MKLKIRYEKFEGEKTEEVFESEVEKESKGISFKQRKLILKINVKECKIEIIGKRMSKITDRKTINKDNVKIFLEVIVLLVMLIIFKIFE